MDPQDVRYQVLIPGKTFLVGEYLALSGGPSIIVNTAPRFEFSWEKERTDREAKAKSVGAFVHHPFHIDSPAGKWLASIDPAIASEVLNQGLEYSIQFKDPFDGRGGLGASTAEFLGAWVFRRWLARKSDWTENLPVVSSLEDHRERVAPNWNSDRIGSNRFRDILDDYRTTTLVGSGADLVSQVTGGLAVWDARIDEMRRFAWPFPDLSLSLFATGKKMATHKYLAKSAAISEASIEEMRNWVDDAVQSLALQDADRLIASVRGFGRVLSEEGRVADHTVSLLEELADLSGVRAAKGCGAMGSDVVLVLHDASAVDQLAEFQRNNGLRLAATQSDIAFSGVEFKTQACAAELSGAST